jgi:hypothetical protein
MARTVFCLIKILREIYGLYCVRHIKILREIHGPHCVVLSKY